MSFTRSGVVCKTQSGFDSSSFYNWIHIPTPSHTHTPTHHMFSMWDLYRASIPPCAVLPSSTLLERKSANSRSSHRAKFMTTSRHGGRTLGVFTTPSTLYFLALFPYSNQFLNLLHHLVWESRNERPHAEPCVLSHSKCHTLVPARLLWACLPDGHIVVILKIYKIYKIYNLLKSIFFRRWIKTPQGKV